MTSTSHPDPRRHAWRDDLAAIMLKGQVKADRYVSPETFGLRPGVTPLRKRPDVGLGYETELVHGELIDIYERRNGWAWGQARRDGYVGYLPEEALSPVGQAPTHRVIAMRSFLYPGASIKATPLGFLPFMAEVSVMGGSGDWCETDSGFLYGPHLAPIGLIEHDPIAVARRFLGVPYLWGGKSSLGYDCSGLVQTVCFACGIEAPRDSDMQEAELGSVLEMPSDPETLPRGALLFWPGHVAMSEGNGSMIHANAFHMQVASEPIAPAIARIAAKGTALRRVRLLPQS